MKRFLLLLLLSVALYGSEVTWIQSYEQALKTAKNEHKPMLLFMNKPGCGSCEYMKESVFTDEAVVKYLEQNYVSVSLNIHKNDAPKELKVSVTPVFHFLSYDGSKLRETLIGGKTAPFFIKLLKQADPSAVK